MRFALAQLNPLVGDLNGNGRLIGKSIKEAISQKADLLITPELSLWGYPPKDLLLNEVQIKHQETILQSLSNTISLDNSNLKVLVGIAEAIPDKKIPKLFNSVALIERNGWEIVCRKQLLPSYDVFDETRYFRPSKSPGVFNIYKQEKCWRIGITICEDLWVEEELQTHRISGPDPVAQLIPAKIDVLLNLSASPFNPSKNKTRKDLVSQASQRLNCPVVYLNQVGANDELIFDGSSFILDDQRNIVLQLPSCKESFKIWDITSQIHLNDAKDVDPMEELFHALVLGVRDYTKKCGFNSALVGLSGGIDSTLVATIATSALGANHVTGLMMPSPWSSDASVSDATELVNRLGIASYKLPISNLMESFDQEISKSFGSPLENIAAENLQSRIRGTLLMAVANQHGHLLLSTGNKSELAVGYCTLYGDMNGGLSVIGDLYKTTVFALCSWLDTKATQRFREEMGLPTLGDVIGKSIRNKAPSAELRANQLDSDSLPDYSTLDPVLNALIEEKYSADQLISLGHQPKIVQKASELLKKSEFKRRQAPPVLKVSQQAFGTGWRHPIATS